MRLNSKQICEYCGATVVVEPIDPRALSCGLTWDSRSVSPGDVYVALAGEKVDGHDFVADALRAGAMIVLVTDRPNLETKLLAQEMGAAIFEVSNTASAIVDIARAWRKALSAHVVALTGSTGKTTTKNLIRDVLKASFSVVATEGNQNNELGVPKTLLRANPETQVLVVEMGMRGRGQISQLCEYVLPDSGLITNIGEGHIELLGSKDNIALAKTELFEALPDGKGRAFLNTKEEYAEFIQENSRLSQRRVELVCFGGKVDDEYLKNMPLDLKKDEEEQALRPTSIVEQGAWADNISLNAQGCPCFTLHIDNEERACSVPLRGMHNVDNVCAAASVGASLGMDIDTIVEALLHVEPERGRQELFRAPDGFVVIDDTYNANPDSMRAALMMLASYDTKGKRIAVLGDMGELGEYAQACHSALGKLVYELGIDSLICVGELARYIGQSALEAGMEPTKVELVDSVANALTCLDGVVFKDDVVLVKASRFMGLERIVGGLVN